MSFKCYSWWQRENFFSRPFFLFYWKRTISWNIEFTILEFAKKVIDKTNSDSQITYSPLPHDDPTQRKPDISLAKENLNWQPKIMLDEGLDKTIEYYKQII